MEFKILGPLEVREEGRRLACKGTKQRLLLSVLLLNANEVVSSDRLIEALWGESPPDTAAKALQVHVSQLRNLLEPERARGASGRILLTRPPGYELRVEPGQLDLHRFGQELSEAKAAMAAGHSRQAARALRNALALWRGPPLADLSFEDFLQPEIARIEELRLVALEERVDADLTLGGHADVIGELESLASQHPLRERLRAQLMLALYRSGRQAEALEVYRETRRLLVAELGIEPGPALKQLERRILAQDAALDVPERQVEAPAEGRPASEDLVGRESEMAELLPVLEGVLSGNGALVLVGGEPGVGKSRFAEALAAHARERSVRVLVGRCWEAGGAPSYWPWVQALRSYVRESRPEALRSQVGAGAADLATIVPELRELLPDLPASPELDSEGARFRLFDSVASFLRNAATAEPLALFLDDLQAADAPSLLLLRFLVGGLAGAAVFIVGCYRDTEVGPDLEEALPELTREAAVRRITLKGLSRSGTARLLELTTGQIPPDGLAARIHAETEGNPLFAGEVGRLLAAEGRLEQADTVEESLPMPEGVREAIGRRLRRQTDRCRQVLKLASVLGREFDLDALERVSDLDQDELFAVLEEAVTARLVSDVPGTPGRLRFSHVLIRDSLYEDLPATRRLRLHLAVSEALEALHDQNLEPHLAELAHHYLQAGSGKVEKAITYAARAGDRAASQLGYEGATRHYESALRLLETAGSGDADRRCELLLSLGDVLSRAGTSSQAKDALRRAATLAEQTGRADQLARAALSYGGRFAWARAGTDPALVPLVERALAAAGPDDGPARARLLARLAAAIRDDPSRDRRVLLAQEAVDVARRSGDPVILAYALEGYWVAVEGPDLVGDGAVVGNQLISLGEQIGDQERVFTGRDFRLNAFWKQADRTGIEVELEALSRLADELRQPSQRWFVATSRTMLALMEGGFGQAEQLISETLALGERAESWNALVSERLQMFVLRRAQGRLAELEETINRSVHEYPALLRFSCALTHLYGDLGREQDARTALEGLLARDLAREHLDAEWLFSMTLLPDPCALLGDDDAAARLYSLLLPYEHLYAQAPVEATFGSVARGLGVLATTLRRFEDAERHFEAALEVERRMRAGPWRAHAQHNLAAMLLARGGPGDREKASGLLDEAVNTYRELGMDSWATRATALTDVGQAPT
jgi:DNA-binding SARP family transcriptional activator